MAYLHATQLAVYLHVTQLPTNGSKEAQGVLYNHTVCVVLTS